MATVKTNKSKTKKKSLTNPTWHTISGETSAGTVDIYNNIPEPSKEALIQCLEDTAYTCMKYINNIVKATEIKVLVKTPPNLPKPKCLTKAIHKHEEEVQDEREVVKHPLKDLIDNPNDDMCFAELIELIDMDISSCGESFVYKRREFYQPHDTQDINKGLPVSMYSLPVQSISLSYDVKGIFNGYIDNRFRSKKFIAKEDMIWFKLPDPRNRAGHGYGPVRAAYERILTAKNEAAYILALYKNQARPDSVIQVKGIVPAMAARMQKEFNERFRRGGIGGVWVTEADDMDIKPLNWSPKDFLSSDLHTYIRLTIMNVFGLNSALFEQEKTRASADAALYQASKNAVEPREHMYAQKFNLHLAKEFDSRLFVEFMSVVPEDDETRIKQEEYKLREQMELLKNGVITVNEVREMRGLKAIKMDKPEEIGENYSN